MEPKPTPVILWVAFCFLALGAGFPVVASIRNESLGAAFVLAAIGIALIVVKLGRG